MNIKAMKQAIEALKGYRLETNEAAIKTLEQAIEQAEKPVGYLFDFEIDGELVEDWFVMREHAIEPTAQNIRPLYATPPQRELVGLTDEEIGLEWYCLHDDEGNPPDEWVFARAIEVKLKEKNHVD